MTKYVSLSRCLYVLICLMYAGSLCGQASDGIWNCCHPKMGAVPDEKSAIAIAKAILAPIYHAEFINSEEPFTASLNKDVWTVTGTPPPQEPEKVEKTPSGTRVTISSAEGPVQVQLSQDDGRLLKCCWPEGRPPK